MDGVEQEVTKGCRCSRNGSCGQSVESNRALLPLIYPGPVLGPSVQRMKVPVKGTNRDPADVLDFLMMRMLCKVRNRWEYSLSDKRHNNVFLAGVRGSFCSQWGHTWGASHCLLLDGDARGGRVVGDVMQRGANKLCLTVPHPPCPHRCHAISAICCSDCASSTFPLTKWLAALPLPSGSSL